MKLIIPIKKLKELKLELTEERIAKLDKLKKKVKANDYIDLVKKALKFYEKCINIIDEGSEILVKDKEGNIKPIFEYKGEKSENTI